MQEKQKPPGRRRSRRASVCMVLSVTLPALATAPAAFAATTTSGSMFLSTTIPGTVGVPITGTSLSDFITGGTSPYTWSVPKIDGMAPSVVGSVYSSATPQAGSVVGKVYGVPSLLTTSSGSTVTGNVYQPTVVDNVYQHSVVGNVYALTGGSSGIKVWSDGNISGTPASAGTISFDGVVTDKNNSTANAMYSMKIV